MVPLDKTIIIVCVNVCDHLIFFLLLYTDEDNYVIVKILIHVYHNITMVINLRVIVIILYVFMSACVCVCVLCVCVFKKIQSLEENHV